MTVFGNKWSQRGTKTKKINICEKNYTDIQMKRQLRTANHLYQCNSTKKMVYIVLLESFQVELGQNM